MARQQLHGFGAFFFVAGVFLLLIAVIVGLTADDNRPVLAAGAMIAFAVAGSICFVAAAITLRPSVDPTHTPVAAARATKESVKKEEWPEVQGTERQDQFTTERGGKP